MRVAVDRGDRLALGYGGNEFVGSDPEKVDVGIVSCRSPVLLPQGQRIVVSEALMRKVYLTKLYSGRQVHVLVLSASSNSMPKQRRRVEIECESL